MIPIKIQCACGQKYAFDAEPVGGHLSCAVHCPSCGADGTAAADRVIAQQLAAEAAPVAGLRIAGSRPQPTIPTPPRIPTGETSTTHIPRVKQRSKWFVPAIGSGVVLVFVLAGAALFGRSHARDSTPVAAAAAANDGNPRTLEELNAWYVEPPGGQNAATFFLRGFNALQINKAASASLPLLGMGRLPPLGAPMPAFMNSALTAFVHSNQEALQCFADGAKCEHSRYPVDLTPGYDTLLSHLTKFKSAGFAVELSAVSHAEAGEGKQAANDVLIGLALARSLEAEPALLSQLIRVTGVSTAVASLEQTVNRTALPRESLGDLLNAFQKIESYDARGEGFKRALTAERVIMMSLLGAPQKLLEPLAGSGPDLSAARRNQIAARLQQADPLTTEQKCFEHAFQQVMTARQDAFPGRLKADDLVRQCVDEAAQKKLIVLEWLVPGLAGRTANEAGCLAQIRLGLTAVALEQFRAAHEQRYPAALSELTPEFLAATPLDPFDGQPLRYRKDGDGYLLYSIGPDRLDDSGERMLGKQGDLVFTVVANAKRRK